MIAALVTAEIVGITLYLAAWNLPYKPYWSALTGLTGSVLLSVPVAVLVSLALS